MLPQADPWGRKIAYTVAMGFSNFPKLRLMGVQKKYGHEGYPNLHLGFTKKIELESVPKALNVISTHS